MYHKIDCPTVVMLVTFLLSSPVLAIVIPADTSVGTWDEVNRIYTLNTDVSESIQIDGTQFTFDGAGHSVKGSGSDNGVYLYGLYYVTVKNLNVQNWRNGIYLDECIRCELIDNTVSDCYYGIYGYWFGSNFLTSNAASNNFIGIYLNHCSATLTDNTATSNYYGVLLEDTLWTMSGNSMSGNTYNFDIWSLQRSNIDTTNTVEGKPIWYLYDVHSGVYGSSTNAGVFYAIYCSNLIIEDMTVTNNFRGVTLHGTTNVTVRNITASNNEYGIDVGSSWGCTLDGNTSSNNSYVGISVFGSNPCTLTDNNTYNNEVGIDIYDVDYCTLTGNTANTNYIGINLSWCTGCTLTGNIVADNLSCGIGLVRSNSCILTDNTISDNAYGLSCYELSGSQIYHNNFIYNIPQAYVLYSSGNIFNLNVPTGGNYWSDWTSPDEDNDGFVDFPYVFTGGQDNLPWAVQDGWLTGPTGPMAMLEALRAYIVEQVELGNIDAELETSLLAKVDAAIRALERENPNDAKVAMNDLKALTNQVEAQTDKKIILETADEIVKRANAITAALGG